VSSLNGAVSLEEMDKVALLVSDDLNLDVPRVVQESYKPQRKPSQLICSCFSEKRKRREGEIFTYAR
jgi:hypothetical protein